MFALPVLLLCLCCLLSPFAVAETDEAAWQHYYQQSAQTLQNDTAAIQAELVRLGQNKAALPAPARRFGFDNNVPASWYQTAEGTALLQSMLSLQTPSGGWSKRTDMSQPRQPGQHFGVEPNYVPTFDNSATTTQLRVLARAYTATSQQEYASAFYRGLQLVFNAQYPNGGWPQTYPLRGGYHDHITLNDGVSADILNLLLDVSRQTGDFAFVSDTIRQQASRRFDHGIALLLKLQVNTAAGMTIWAGQYHHRSLTPAPARAYEMVALSTAESAAITRLLMRIEQPSAAVINAVQQAANWFLQHQLADKLWHPTKRVLLDRPGSHRIWPRFAEIGSNKALFADRDGIVVYDVHQVSLERRLGYGWYTDTPEQVLSHYDAWHRQHAATTPR
ncbi:pectate lyase, PelA/Pel-15E family [Arsukibacterium tuosuense]|uniref:Pectate lyase, PelA/Pel-15E family n=1 Tax=Arsukibacterium tuosuense TaxID=1323745 RepID=A0A285ICJ1_9GAMM|nr:pectate lyase [Arsukibacterium tuosuense]SNY45698.1 pectate lyase, PelA/Pel-15E family [Arsukibacterium tuosuense]